MTVLDIIILTLSDLEKEKQIYKHIKTDFLTEKNNSIDLITNFYLHNVGIEQSKNHIETEQILNGLNIFLKELDNKISVPGGTMTEFENADHSRYITGSLAYLENNIAKIRVLKTVVANQLPKHMNFSEITGDIVKSVNHKITIFPIPYAESFNDIIRTQIIPQAIPQQVWTEYLPPNYFSVKEN
ncbi:MAG: hypothetical protein ACP5NV_04935 [Candidatus Woesearchaeota archaeon]